MVDDDYGMDDYVGSLNSAACPEIAMLLDVK